MKGWTIAVALVALVTGAGDSTAPEPPRDPKDPIVIRFIELVEVVRANEGCGPLTWHDGAAAVASLHSRDMASRDYFSHTNPDGVGTFERIAAGGIRYSIAAENLLHGASTATRALELWLGSPGHRSNLLNCTFTHHGVGRVDTHWTHIFLTDPA